VSIYYALYISQYNIFILFYYHPICIMCYYIFYFIKIFWICTHRCLLIPYNHFTFFKKKINKLYINKPIKYIFFCKIMKNNVSWKGCRQGYELCTTASRTALTFFICCYVFLKKGRYRLAIFHPLYSNVYATVNKTALLFLFLSLMLL
jgi:hypothetical protein